ncbi:hypothetical protein, partial [Klebsiella pneumoniae]|uniref:hypothetical protein n=1 Tax=Klebsiella pneumoniae TaxID=573 RepID=UPI0024DE9CE4
ASSGDFSGLAVVLSSVEYTGATSNLEHARAVAVGHDGVPSTVRARTTSFAGVGYSPRTSQTFL